MTPKGEHLFPELNKARYGEARRLRPLFLPNLLQQEPKKFLEEPAQNAHQIMCKWADIESSGKLDKMKETAIEGEFCKDIFGDALGYTLFSEDKESWNLEPKFSVNGGCPHAQIYQK
jgi:hypothetical protein